MLHVILIKTFQIKRHRDGNIFNVVIVALRNYVWFLNTLLGKVKQTINLEVQLLMDLAFVK